MKTERDFSFEMLKGAKGIDLVKVFHKNIRKDEDGEIISESSGYELCDKERAAQIWEGTKEQLKMVQEQRTRKIVLNSEEIRMKRSMENIVKAKDYENKLKAGKEKFETELEKEEEQIAHAKRLKQLWEDINQKFKALEKPNSAIG